MHLAQRELAALKAAAEAKEASRALGSGLCSQPPLWPHPNENSDPCPLVALTGAKPLSEKDGGQGWGDIGKDGEDAESLQGDGLSSLYQRGTALKMGSVRVVPQNGGVWRSLGMGFQDQHLERDT